jgi:uncharacterized protein (DUF305 family)
MRINRAVLRKLALSTAAGTGAFVLLTACGGTTAGSGNEGASPTPPTTASASARATFNPADVMFAQMMIPHHQQAVEMAELAETRAADPEIKELAQKIKAAQDPEIATMRGWLRAWGAPEMLMGEEHSGHGMPGMMTEEDMAELEASEGGTFDRMFAEMMIEHHEGALEMARTELSRGANADAKELAERIIATQQAEIDQMKAILRRL